MNNSVWQNPDGSIYVHGLSDDPVDGTSQTQAVNLGALSFMSGRTLLAVDYANFPNAPQESWWWDGTAIVVDVAKIKNDQRRVINAERNLRETAGFTYNGKLFDSDQRSADRIQIVAFAAQSALMSAQPFSIDWTAADNSVVTLDAQGMIALAVAFATHGATLHATAKQIKAQVDAATTVAQVEAVAWPA